MKSIRPRPPEASDSPLVHESEIQPLKQQAVRGGALTLGAQWLKLALHLGTTIVLARVLSPHDYGLIAMVTAVTGLFQVFETFGLSAATIQRPRITHSQVSTLFWVNAAVGLLLFLFTASLSPWLARFYNEPRLLWVTTALGGTFLLGSLKVQHQAMLKRHLRFSVLATIELSSLLIGTFTAIFLARLSTGYWALVGMQLATVGTSLVLTWWSYPWLPQWPNISAGSVSLLKFGANLTLTNVLFSIGRNLDKLLIGRFCGSAALGLYSKAYGLMALPLHQLNTPLASVAIPVLSRLREEPDRFRRYYCRLVSAIAFVSFPPMLAAAAISEELVSVLLGHQWAEAGVLFGILALASVWQPVGHTRSWVYVALGQVRRQRRWALIQTPILAMAVAIGLPAGPLGVAASLVISSWMLQVPAFAYAFSHSPIRMQDFVLAVRRPALLGLIVYATMNATHPWWGHQEAWQALVSGGSLGILSFVLALLCWPAARREAVDLLHHIKTLRSSAPGPVVAVTGS